MKMFSRNDEGSWCFLGWPIFGFYLPFLGFKEYTMSDEEVNAIEATYGYELVKGSKMNFLCAEWLGYGVKLGRVKFAPREIH